MAVSAGTDVVLRDESAVADRLSEEEKLRPAEAYHLRRSLGDDIWTGRESLEIPQIVYNERHAFLLAYPAPPNGWQTGAIEGDRFLEDFLADAVDATGTRERL